LAGDLLAFLADISEDIYRQFLKPFSQKHPLPFLKFFQNQNHFLILPSSADFIAW
jgi:hypothetical protein